MRPRTATFAILLLTCPPLLFAPTAVATNDCNVSAPPPGTCLTVGSGSSPYYVFVGPTSWNDGCTVWKESNGSPGLQVDQVVSRRGVTPPDTPVHCM